ncbi:flippase [Bacillus sp. FJAT-27225]|uniref:flippase n=1 Tax=Bacillus sp. FJAT-27225 TaxID=1743144 RepID=UPI0011122455|nr:flippase [Bacillus sp. FJAT-27225]
MAKNSFLKNTYITLVRQITSIIIGFLLIMIIARVLGSTLQGHYGIITTFAATLVMMINMGWNISTVYYVSKEEVSVQQAFYNNLLIGIFLSVVGIAGGFAFIALFGGGASFDQIPDKSSVYLILFAIPFMLLNTFFQTIFQGIQDFKIFNTILVFTQISNLLFVLFLVVIFNLGLQGALFAFILGHVATFLFIITVFLKKFSFSKQDLKLNVPYLKKSFRYGFKSYLSNLVTFFNYRINVYILYAFASPAAFGVYFTALNLSEKLSVFTQSISSVLLPRIASMGTEEERNRLTSIVSRFTMIFMAAFSLVVFLLIDIIVPILGNDYLETPFLIKVLLPGISLLAVEKILSNDIAARGKPEVNLYVSIFNVVLSTILNLILIPEYKATGAAIATSISYSLSFLIKSFLFKRITGEKLSGFLLIKPADIVLLRKLINQFKNKLQRRHSG